MEKVSNRALCSHSFWGDEGNGESKQKHHLTGKGVRIPYDFPWGANNQPGKTGERVEFKAKKEATVTSLTNVKTKRR